MKKDAIRHFGSIAKLAAAIGYTPQAIYKWGRIVPLRAQYIVQVASGGALKAEERVR